MTEHREPVGMISNPGSGHNRGQFGAIRERINSQPRIHHLVTESPDDILPALEQLRDRAIGVLAINGGDGTASAVLGTMLQSGLFEKMPRIVLLPGGTANMNAGDIGVPGSLKKAVQRFCQWCDASGPNNTTRDNSAQRPLLEVRLPGHDTVHHGMFLGGGAIIQGTEYAHEEVHSRGLRDDFSLALTTVRTVWGVLRDDPRFNRHVTLDLSLNDSPGQRYDTLILAISTLERLAFGMRPFWASGPGSIRLTLMEQGCTKFGRTFFSIARGRPNKNAVVASGYRSHNADRLAISMQGKLNLDGEVLEVDGTVQISASRPLEFLLL